MTVIEALARFDEIVARSLADSETVLRNHGASEEEVAVEMNRLHLEMAGKRREVLAFMQACVSGSEPVIWPPDISSRTH